MNAGSGELSTQARRRFVQTLLRALPEVVRACVLGLESLCTQAALPALALERREALQALDAASGSWLSAWQHRLQQAADRVKVAPEHGGEAPSAWTGGDSTDFLDTGHLSLVDDATIECEILASRLSLALTDVGSWEQADLRNRLRQLEGLDDLPADDLLRPQVLAKVSLDAWQDAGMTLPRWRLIQAILHDELGDAFTAALHDSNAFLQSAGVMPEVDLRPLIRRSTSAPGSSMPGADSGSGGGTPHRTAGSAGPTSAMGGLGGMGPGAAQRGGGAPNTGWMGARHEDTLLMTRLDVLQKTVDRAQGTLKQLNAWVEQHVGTPFVRTVGLDVSPELQAALAEPVQDPAAWVSQAEVSTQQLVQRIQQQKAHIKQNSKTPVERATIEVVALLFQAILTEERLPPAIRVWFARLQIPVLRVAVSEPEFFGETTHPARRLIDRMGACVMGFEGQLDEALEREIRRVVQVVEAYPDTGRRVFQTVLNEFEKFIAAYFQNENEASKKAVSLAQQVEQREILTIQYTIELRKMLDEVPVTDGVRDFLFQVWADVLATHAVKHGNQSESIKQMKRAAADLIWSASAKVNRDERSEVIRRLPPLLKVLREGMQAAGLHADKQEQQIQALNRSLAAAFTAKTATLSNEHLRLLTVRLETLEEMLPDAEEIDIDETMVFQLHEHDSQGLEIVADGGTVPGEDMLKWARGLEMGDWFRLDYRGQIEPVQLAWQGLRKQLSLFVARSGRCVLFQQHRLAAFLQAGLMQPVEEEALTVRATRDALAKLDADPGRLLS